MINRIILAVALAGAILTLHLWVQQERGFDRGCWGLGETASSASVEPCRVVAASEPEVLGGVPVVVLGFGFYALVAIAALAKTVVARNVRLLMTQGLRVATIAGLACSAYLIYWQGFVVRAFCPLCLVSSALVAILAILQGFEKPSNSFSLEQGGWVEFAQTGVITAVGISVAAGVLFFVDRVGVRRLGEGADARELDTMLARALPRHIDPMLLKDIAACRVDVSSLRLRVPEWINTDTPALKSRRGSPVVFFLDPNCPHCPQAYAMARRLDEQFEDRAGCFVLPLVLWDHSLLQVQALEVARREGKYFEMWQAQLDQRKPEGLGFQDLLRIAENIGLETRGFGERLEQVKSAVLDWRARTRRAGIRMSPSIYVNGSLVASTNMSESCVTQLIDRGIRARMQIGTPISPGIQLRRESAPPNAARGH